MKKYLPIRLNLFVILFICSVAQANDIEQKFIASGLVDVSTIDPSIQVDLVNSDPKKNFFRENYYNGLEKAYLQREVAIKLSNAQKLLKLEYPSYSLQILDAARPRSISQAMYDKMKGTEFERFVADPSTGSMHNYGVAVDITILDSLGNDLDMGITPFKKSTLKIYWDYAISKLGKSLTKEQKKNRDLLSSVMQKSGFSPLNFEWWHFDGVKKEQARQLYKIIE